MVEAVNNKIFGFGAMLDIQYLVIGLIGGFILSFVGGWIGEEMQKRKEAKTVNSKRGREKFFLRQKKRVHAIV